MWREMVLGRAFPSSTARSTAAEIRGFVSLHSKYILPQNVRKCIMYGSKEIRYYAKNAEKTHFDVELVTRYMTVLVSNFS